MTRIPKTGSRGSVRELVDQADWPALTGLLTERPGQMRHLLTLLHETDGARLERTLEAFAEAVPRAFDDARLADLARKLLWLLNEESGNHCPSAALALAAIGQTRSEIVAPHLPVLRVHAHDPSSLMAETVTEALRRLGETGTDSGFPHGESAE